jgi:hypothetical protein
MKAKAFVCGIALGFSGAAALATELDAASPPQWRLDHLEPVWSPYLYGNVNRGDYDDLLIALLAVSYGRDVVLRGIGYEGDFPYAVALEITNETYRVLVLEPGVFIWDYLARRRELSGGLDEPIYDSPGAAIYMGAEELRAMLPDELRNIDSERCSYEIDTALARRLIDVWGKMLLNTRHANDGVEVFDVRPFLFFTTGREAFYPMEGIARRHDPGTAPEMLVRIVLSMRALCQARDPGTLDDLDERVAALEARLQ